MDERQRSFLQKDMSSGPTYKLTITNLVASFQHFERYIKPRDTIKMIKFPKSAQLCNT